MTTASHTSLPRVSDCLLPRPHLDRRLSEWAPVTVVRGLHGYGKTTQLAVWLESQSSEDVRWVWVTARPASDEAQTFEECLHRRLQTSGAVVSEPASGHVASNGLAELDTALLNARPDRRFVLIADDFQHIHDERVLAELIGLVKRHRHFHLYVCCRGRHPIESLAAGTVEINAIEPKELLLEIDEIANLSRMMSKPVDHAAAQGLRNAVGGSISAIRMALSAGETAGPRPIDIEEYLRTQVLPEVGNEGLLEPLMRFSLAGTLNWRMLRDLADDADPSRLLEALEATGMLERVADAREVRFTIPTPFRDILRDHYASTEPRAAEEFHRRLAEWFAARDDQHHISFAFFHAAAGKNWTLMDALWFDNVAMLCNESVDLLRETLDSLPAHVLASRPSMQVVRDTLKIARPDTDADGPQTTLRAFAEASGRVVRQHWDTMSANELLIVATGYLIQLRLRGRFQDSAAVGDRVNAKSGTRASTQRVSASRLAWFHLHRGITYSLLHDDTSAIRSYARAWEHATSSGDDLVRSHAAANLALTYGLGGGTEPSLQWLERHRNFATQRWAGHDVVGIGGHLASGFLALDRLDLAGVRAELEFLGDGSAPLELWPFIAFLYAQHALHAGLTVEALARLDQLRAAHDDEVTNKGAAAALMTRARADLLIACGRGERATRLLAPASDMPLTRVPAARIRLLARAADATADICPSTWDAATSIRDRLEMLLLGATASLRSEDPRNTQRLMNQALNLYGDTGILRPFATIPKADLAQLLAFADRDLEPHDAARLAEHSPAYPARIVLIELSERERSVLTALAANASRQAIADSLFVSINTVKTQLASIYQKFGSTTRQETLAEARRLDFLPGEPEPRRDSS